MRVVYSTSSCGSLWASVLAGLPQDAWSPALPIGSDGRGGDSKLAVNISTAKEACEGSSQLLQCCLLSPSQEARLPDSAVGTLASSTIQPQICHMILLSHIYPPKTLEEREVKIKAD